MIKVVLLFFLFFVLFFCFCLKIYPEVANGFLSFCHHISYMLVYVYVFIIVLRMVYSMIRFDLLFVLFVLLFVLFVLLFVLFVLLFLLFVLFLSYLYYLSFFVLRFIMKYPMIFYHFILIFHAC